jgi:hypothetical protein
MYEKLFCRRKTTFSTHFVLSNWFFDLCFLSRILSEKLSVQLRMETIIIPPGSIFSRVHRVSVRKIDVNIICTSKKVTRCQCCQIFFFVQQTKTGNKFTKRIQIIQNDHKIYHMTVKQTKWPYNIPTLSISRPSKIYPKLGFWFENNPSGNPARCGLL